MDALSGTTVSTPAAAASGSRGEPPGGTSLWRDPVTWVIVITTLVAAGLRLYQFTRPGYLLGLTEYDDGPYFGSAVRLTNGLLPYRDFIFVQPPGITLLMTPVALLAKVTGTAWALGIGRILTALGSAAGVPLLGLLVRHRGLFATLVSCGVLAVFPYSIQAAHTVLVEGWLALFCLIGAVIVFDRDRLATGRRLLWGGVAFGFAGAVEPWAIVPVLVVLALCLPSVRRAVVFVAGVAAGFLVPVIPFAALSPRGFYLSLIVAQIGPRASARRVGLWTRVRFMSGVGDTRLAARAAGIVGIHPSGHAVVAITALIIVALIVGGTAAVILLTRRPPAPLDGFALATTAGVVAMFLWPSQFHYHFSAFLAPFLGLAVALPLGRLLGITSGRLARGRDAAGAAGWLPWAAAGVMAVVLVMFGTAQFGSESTLKPYLYPARAAAAERVIPPGACVATDTVALLLIANRFTSSVPGCPAMVDGLGTDLALSGGLKPATGAGRVPAVASVWMQEFSHAQFAWLSGVNGRRIPWTPALRAYFQAHFTLVTHIGGDTLYRRLQRTSGQGQRSGG